MGTALIPAADKSRKAGVAPTDAPSVTCAGQRFPKGKFATENALLGPFYVSDAPLMDNGDSIVKQYEGEPLRLEGRVTGEGGAPLVGAQVEVWQIAANGAYDGQDPDMVENNMRGRSLAAEDGRYWLMTNRPYGYSVPTDGPVGRDPVGFGIGSSESTQSLDTRLDRPTKGLTARTSDHGRAIGRYGFRYRGNRSVSNRTDPDHARHLAPDEALGSSLLVLTSADNCRSIGGNKPCLR
jgi:protocatechuate 3,4-dioxygenase beta subunit